MSSTLERGGGTKTILLRSTLGWNQTVDPFILLCWTILKLTLWKVVPLDEELIRSPSEWGDDVFCSMESILMVADLNCEHFHDSESKVSAFRGRECDVESL